MDNAGTECGLPRGGLHEGCAVGPGAAASAASGWTVAASLAQRRDDRVALLERVGVVTACALDDSS
ncbi:MAG: hypothetical protein ACLQU3_21690 [Limisphaerales bacterium]